jgi:hypothetical protein
MRLRDRATWLGLLLLLGAMLFGLWTAPDRPRPRSTVPIWDTVAVGAMTVLGLAAIAWGVFRRPRR